MKKTLPQFLLEVYSGKHPEVAQALLNIHGCTNEDDNIDSIHQYIFQILPPEDERDFGPGEFMSETMMLNTQERWVVRPRALNEEGK